MSGRGSENEIAAKLTGDDVPKSLMKCYGLLDENNIVYERIDGKTLKDWLFDKTDTTRIPFDVFCKDWVMSMFEGMNYFYNHIKFDLSFTKKGITTIFKSEPHLPRDMTDINIMVRNPSGSMKYPAPVRIDYGTLTWGSTDVLMRLADMLSYVMKTKVEYSDAQKTKFDELYKFLNFSDDYRRRLAYNTTDAKDYWFDSNDLVDELKKTIS